MQDGFDSGLSEGIEMGFKIGRIYAACRLKLAAADDGSKPGLLLKIAELERLVMHSVHRSSGMSLLSIVTELALGFGVVAEDIARIGGDQQL